MSKEMLVIVLGVVVILTRTMLGIPGEWQTIVLVVCGAALVVVGFLLRGESISRASAPRAVPGRSTHTFAEHLPERPDPTPAHDHKEGITSLN